MVKRSAGLLMYRWRERELEVFLVHPGGPFWQNKDVGVWTIPKGELGPEEQPIDAAKREFVEETGFALGNRFEELGTIRQAGGKFVSGWAFEGDGDPAQLVSNTCNVEWPPRSGRIVIIPEVDRGRWFQIEEARLFLKDTQAPFLDRLLAALAPVR